MTNQAVISFKYAYSAEKMVDYPELIHTLVRKWGIQILFVEFDDVNAKAVEDLIHACEKDGIFLVFQTNLKYLKEAQKFPTSDHYILHLRTTSADIRTLQDKELSELKVLTNKIKVIEFVDLPATDAAGLSLPYNAIFLGKDSSEKQFFHRTNPNIQHYIENNNRIDHIQKIGAIRNKGNRYLTDAKNKIKEKLLIGYDIALRRWVTLRCAQGVYLKIKGSPSNVRDRFKDQDAFFNRLFDHTLAIANDETRHLHVHEVYSKSYRPLMCRFDKMNGSLEWRSARATMLNSTVITKTLNPQKISAQFSGKVRYVGYRIGRDRYVMTTMDRTSHVLSLYIEKNGQYFLEKDQTLVDPIHIPGFITPPAFITQHQDVSMASYFIDGSMITQRVLASGHEEASAEKLQNIDFSIVVACTKYSRRLQQLVQSLANQDYDLSKIEIMVAFVPGLDITEDILDTIKLCHPTLNITRVPFSQAFMTHKWTMINQTIEKSSGKRILVTDADIVFPPDLFQKLSKQYADAFYLGISGRKMLSPMTTAKILHGLINPSKEFDHILQNDSGELRIDEAKGKPVGYFQCFTREVADKVKYRELPHFEGSDGFFTEDVRKIFGKETIAQDILVLHLDHQGSRWYGTDKQM